MKATTSKYKQKIAAGTFRNYLIKVDLTLADNTVLHLTEADIWEDSFGIETASSGNSTFDIGTAVIGKCTFTINNIDGDFDNYDFFNANAVVWLGLEGDATGTPAVQQYYRMGFFTVDEPQKANGLISLSLLDNMWKFDVPFSGVTLNYPITAVNAVLAICSYCGVTLAGTSANFHGYNFSIAEAPKDKDNMNCREMLQYIAMLGCNFCTIDAEGKLEIKWYDVNATSSTTDVFDYNQRTSFGTEDIEITGVKFVIDNTDYTIGTNTYRLELENPLVTTSNVSSVLNLIWDVLDGFTLRTFNLTAASDLAVEVGDKIKIRDYQGNYVYSWVTLNSFKFANHGVQCNAEAPNRTLVKRYSKTVQAAVEVARQQTNEIISNYDLAVQMMNDLAVNAMGGYEDYEDIGTGGRVWYLSNMPITKSAQGVCSFEPNSTVYKKSGSGFFVSRDGGQTWVNGYNTQTGELVVNVLDAIGINFDWARGGTLTLGGYGNGHGLLSILDASNVEKVRGDNTGVAVGSDGAYDSKIKLTTDGEFDYYYGGNYAGKMRMYGRNYGTQQNPDIRDTLELQDFYDIFIESENEKSYFHLSTDHSTNEGEIRGGAKSVYLTTGNESAEHAYIDMYRASSDAKIILYADNNTNYSEVRVEGGGIHLNGAIFTNNGSQGASGNVEMIDSSWHRHSIDFEDGVCVGDTQGSVVDRPDYLHTWEAGGVTYSAIVLSAGVSQADFPDIDTNGMYEPYMQVASGQPLPMIEEIKITGTTYSVKFETITSAQAAGGACVIKLIRKGIV